MGHLTELSGCRVSPGLPHLPNIPDIAVQDSVPTAPRRPLRKQGALFMNPWKLSDIAAQAATGLRQGHLEGIARFHLLKIVPPRP